MPARLLAPLARIALSLWVGAMACVAALVAPRAFRVLPDARRAGDFLAPLFRAIDLLGVAAAALALLAARAAPRAPGRGPRAALLGALGTAAAFDALVLGPRVAERDARFALLHGASLALWALMLLGGITLLATSSPRSDAPPAP